MSDIEENKMPSPAKENEESYRSQLKTRKLYECAIKMTATLKDLYFDNKKQKEVIENYKENIERLEEELLSVNNRLAEAEEGMKREEESKENIERLEEELLSVNSRLTEAQDREKQRDEKGREEVEALEQELLSVKASLAEAREGMKREEESKEKIQKLEEELLSVKNSLAKAQEDLEKVKEENKEIIQNLEAELQSTTDRLARSENVGNDTMERLEVTQKLLEEANAARKSEQGKTQEMSLSIQKLEADVNNAVAMARERNETYAQNILEWKRGLQEKAEENETLAKQLAEEKAKRAKLIETCNRKEADLSIHKQSMQDLMTEIVDLREKLTSMSESHEREMTSRKGTLDNMQKSLKLSIKWLVYFGKKLQETGDSTSECDELKLFSDVMDLNQSVDSENHVDVFCSFSDALNIPFPSTSGASRNNVQGKQSSKTKHQSSIALLALDNEDSDTQNENWESSEMEITSRVMFPQLSSTPYSTRKSKKSFEDNCLPLKRTCTRGDSQLRTTDVVKTHLPSNAVPTTDRAGNSSQNQNAPNIRFGNNEEILISFPITPLLREQSVNLHYDRDRVQVGYQQFRRDCSEAVSSSQAEESNSPPNPAEWSRADLDSDIIIIESDENDIAAPVINENAVAIDPRDIPSCSSAPFLNLEGNRSAYIPAEGNRSAHIPAGHRASPEENVRVHADEDQEVSAPAPGFGFNHFLNASNLPQEVICPEVARAFEQLVVTRDDDDDELKRKCDLLKTSLRNCTDSQAVIAANMALGFLCSRNVNPLQDYLTSSDEVQLFPLDELCVVKVFNNMGRSIFRDKLEDVLYKEIVERGEKYSVVILSTLCRVWAYLRGVKKCIPSARSMCYHLLKRYPDTAPFLIAAIVSVYTTALELPVIESEKCLYRVFRYMIANKPENLPDNLWSQATHLISQHLSANTRATPENIVQSIVRSFMERSRDGVFSPSDAKNYVDAIEILSSRFDWNWVFHNVLDGCLIPGIVTYSSSPSSRYCGGIALAYRITGSLGSGQSGNSNLMETVKSTYARMSDKKERIPAFVFEEARYAIFLIETGRKEIGITGGPFKEWVVQNGYV